MAFEHLTEFDQQAVMRWLEEYTGSRAVMSKDSIGSVREFRRMDAEFYWDLRAKLRKLLGPGFPALARAWKVARTLERSGLQTR